MDDLKQQFLDAIDQRDLSHLGSQDELVAYLREEFKELDLSDRWDEVGVPNGTLQPNPYNILLYFLAGTHEEPSELKHEWDGEGDFPDIDLDFEPDARDRIKEYLKDRFGDRNCMEVVTLGGTNIKGAIQDLARIEAQQMSTSIDSRIEELKSAGTEDTEILSTIDSEFPNRLEPKDVYKVTTQIKYNPNDDEQNTLEYIYNHYGKVRKFLDDHPKIHDNVKKMQDIYRGMGTHASAFIIANVPVDEYIPVVLNKQKNIVTGYTESSGVKALNKTGLIKFDILGLENLTVNRVTEQMIKDRYNGEVDWDNIDIDDPEIYKLVRKGLNGGVFQIDSPVAAGIINTIEPDCFEDLSAVNALIRPACLEAKSHEAYINHKRGKFDREQFPVWLDLEGKVSDFTFELLNDTYGIPIYQEQIMALLAEFCEVDLDETNKMRKIIGIPASKKKPEHWEYIDSQKEIFLKNAGARIGDLLAWQWWEAAVGSLSYGFNRSHSVAYAMVAFRQLFLKKYFPKEFYCALLQTEHAASNANKKSKLMQFIIEAKHLGVPIESPHIDKSKRELDYHGDVIFIGFEQIKGVGGKAVDHIIERGPYTSFQDFIDKHAKGTGSKVSKTVIEALLYTDAFRDFGSRQDHLRTLYYHNLLKTVKKDPEKLQAAWDAYEEPTRFDLLKKEHDLLTTVLSEDDPLDLPFGYKRITEAIDSPKDRVCKLKGIVESKQTLTAKSSGNKYIRMTINDLENSCTVLIWRNQFGMVYDAVEGSIIQIEATHKDGDTFFLKRCIKIENEE